ncbi:MULTISPECIES: phosphonate C-P lyase system protein PhnH [unclassified Sinorhizobium]|uniref:phosphonate C-P lyase system protein PhnH n=1 Tax=unclassified Sinorhizobium TaxID=2613772 RepID=UPI003523F42C
MMQTMLVPTAEDLRTNATFDALMWALARPGLIQPLPVPGVLPLAESLLDRECSFFCSDVKLAAQIIRTGADAVSLAEAEYVFTSLEDPRQISALSSLLSGNLLYPDASATIFAPAVIGSGTPLRLSGPGINGSVDIAVDGVDRTFWTLRNEAIRYPLGWDIYLADGDRLIGIPRSIKIEVL